MSRGLIHELTVRNRTGSTRDAEGRFTNTWSRRRVPGRVSWPREDETPAHGQTEADRTAFAIVPLGTDVSRSSEVDVANTGVLGLDGTFEVTGIHPNRLHVRLVLRRAGV